MIVGLNFVLATTILAVIFPYGNSAIVFNNIPKDITDNIFIYLIVGPTYDDRVILKLEDGLNVLNSTAFKESRTSMFYCHGYTESAYNKSAVVIGNAFLSYANENILIFDYSVLVTESVTSVAYVGAVLNATLIGEAIGQFFKQFIPTVQPKELIHIIGHSLGSQVMAQMAITYGKGILLWLTALDPAGPLYYDGLVEPHLDASSGVFVDIIHTDANLYGDGTTNGTVDFYPNRGTRVQPYCQDTSRLTDDFCSHHMSYEYYAESLKNNQAFLGKQCVNTALCNTDLTLCTCSSTYAVMGYSVNKSTTGSFYLTTNINPPWGQGMAGTNFNLNLG